MSLLLFNFPVVIIIIIIIIIIITQLYFFQSMANDKQESRYKNF